MIKGAAWSGAAAWENANFRKRTAGILSAPMSQLRHAMSMAGSAVPCGKSDAYFERLRCAAAPRERGRVVLKHWCKCAAYFFAPMPVPILMVPLPPVAVGLWSEQFSLELTVV